MIFDELEYRAHMYLWVHLASHLKNASNAQLQRCEPLQNAHMLAMYAPLFHRLAPCPWT